MLELLAFAVSQPCTAYNSISLVWSLHPYDMQDAQSGLVQASQCCFEDGVVVTCLHDVQAMLFLSLSYVPRCGQTCLGGLI